MSRYYYDCAIEAAYMAKNFDFKLRSARNQRLYFDGGSDFRAEKDCGIYAGEYYFVDPDSLKLLDAQEDDLITWSGNIGQAYPDRHGENYCMVSMLAQLHGYNPFDKNHIIIQRHCKPFIMPKQKTPVKQEIE